MARRCVSHGHGALTRDVCPGPSLTTRVANRGRACRRTLGSPTGRPQSRGHLSDGQRSPRQQPRPASLTAPPRPGPVVGSVPPIRASDAVPYVALSLQEFAGICSRPCYTVMRWLCRGNRSGCHIRSHIPHLLLGWYVRASLESSVGRGAHGETCGGHGTRGGYPPGPQH
jgi:hypothetical protein